MEYRIWKYIHAHPSDILSLLREESIDYHTIVSEVLLLSDMFQILDHVLIDRINLLYQLMIDSTHLYHKTEEQLINLIKEFKQKFDQKCCKK